MLTRDVLIIGAGPSGLAAAIQLRRYGVGPLVLEKSTVGGLLNNANLVENYPGFPQGIEGPQLVERMQDHAQAFAVEIRSEEVVKLNRSQGTYEVRTSVNCYQAPTVIVASGTKPLQPSNVNIDASVADGVFYEVFPLRDCSGQTIAIVGAGDAAFDYALNLAPQNKVILLNRSDSIKALPLLIHRVQASSEIAYEPNVHLSTIAAGANFHLRLLGHRSAQDYQLEVDKVVFAIGRAPQLDFLTPDLSANPHNDNFHIIGDVANGLFRQTSIAVADGVAAAMQIHQESQEQDT